MEINKTDRRISIIKEALKKESSGVLFAGMTEKQRAQLCSLFNVSEAEIVGYYEDIMNLGKTILANARGKFANQGLLFLKDAFVYRKNLIDGITRVYYDDITFVNKGSLGTKVDYNYKGKTATIFLSGIAYADSNDVIPDLLIRLKELSSAKVASYQRVKKSEVKRETKREEKQDNINKWNAHIRECARKNRIAQIQHLDDYMQFPSFIHSAIMAKLVCKEWQVGDETKRSANIVLYSKDGIDFDCYNLPIDQGEAKRVFLKIIPFFIVASDDEPNWWLRREKWNHGSNYDCDDSYSGRTYFFADGQEDHDSCIKTENDVFVQKNEIPYLPDCALLFLADLIDGWKENNFSEIVGSYDLWKNKKEFLLGYENMVCEEIKKRGIKRFSDKQFSPDDQFINYGEQGEKDVEYALKWLPKEYRIIERIDQEGIRLFDQTVSDESQEIDHIVVGPNGIFLIETKYLKGNVTIDHNGNWSRVVDDERKGIRNPIQQIDRHHTIVKSILNNLVCDEDIHDIICLAHPESTIDGEDNSPVKVVRSDMLARYITNCSSKKKYKDSEMNEIIEAVKKHRIN